METRETILVVEDEELLRESLLFNLRKEGYEVLAAEDGDAALEIFHSNPLSLILLDILLPGKSGWEICRTVRAQNDHVGIIFLTAKDERADMILGLDMGADDYMTKPFDLQELLARIRSVLRRRTKTEQIGVITVGPLLIDPLRHQATLAGERLDLTPKEFMLLRMLASSVGKVIAREEILKEVWSEAARSSESSLDVHIRNLRKKLAHEPKVIIETVHKIGYRLELAE